MVSDKVQGFIGWSILVMVVMFAASPTMRNQTSDFLGLSNVRCESQYIKQDAEYTTDRNKLSPGKQGEVRVCYRDEKEISRETLVQPVSTVIYTAPPPEPKYTPTYNTVEEEYDSCVSVCNDGWCSQSSGRGTCSYHGGVRY